MKPGFKTTEFWLSSIASMVGILLSSGVFAGGVVAQGLGVAAVVLTSLGYTVVRGALKKKEYEPSQYRQAGSIRLHAPSEYDIEAVHASKGKRAAKKKNEAPNP